MTDRPLLSLSLDLDNKWSYLKTHGDPEWSSHPTYLDELVDVLLPRLEAHSLRITFFIVGQDAVLARNREALRAIADAGHEIGNHSFHHEPWLHLYDHDKLQTELSTAEEAIFEATGHRPNGFRGPGFSVSRRTLEVLAARGYRYDASTLPTFLGPLARAYYFWSSRNLSKEERRDRSRLFGTMREGLRPLKPYRWTWDSDGDAASLMEIPVTTMPILRAPFHQSYLLYLAGYSPMIARLYLRLAITLCRLTRTQPSFLLHPLDFLGGDRVEGLSFFPGMSMPTARKLELFDDTLRLLGRRFRIVTMGEHASAIAASRMRHADTRSLPA